MSNPVNTKRPREITLETAGILGLSPLYSHDSASRKQMVGQQIGQALVLKRPEPKLIQSGIEGLYSTLTHSIKMPCNARIIRVLQKAPKTLASSPAHRNPLITIIYENVDDQYREIGCIDIPRYHTLHQHFGFPFSIRGIINGFAPGTPVSKGTILADTPSNDTPGGYKQGINANLVCMSIGPVIEDGAQVSESFCKRMATTACETRTFSWGETDIPLNSYGNDKHYKPYPNIGDVIREDGLIFATREYDPRTAPVMMTRKALQQLDEFDEAVYINGTPGARVTDVKVYRGRAKRRGALKVAGMEDQVLGHYNQQNEYYSAIVKEYKALKRHRGDGVLHLSPQFEALVVEALSHLDMVDNKLIRPLFNYRPISEWMVVLTIEYDVIPDKGFKITDYHGGKGIIVKVVPDEDMPCINGVYADVVMCGDSTGKRMNYGKFYEQHINACALTLEKRIRSMMRKYDAAEYEAAYELLMEFYGIVSPILRDKLIDAKRNKRQHIDAMLQTGVVIYLPPDNPVDDVEMALALHKAFPVDFGHATYRGECGNMITTVNKMMMGKIYWILLEKTGKSLSAVSSARQQHYGIPARISRADRYNTPGRVMPIRFGESEFREFAATCGGDAVAELSDMTNNPLAHVAIVEKILESDTPTDIHEAIDRKALPRGKGRIITYTKHMLGCAGVEIVRTEGEDV